MQAREGYPRTLGKCAFRVTIGCDLLWLLRKQTPISTSRRRSEQQGRSHLERSTMKNSSGELLVFFIDNSKLYVGAWNLRVRAFGRFLLKEYTW
jgi:hypothetical protein